jgi:hypothetical protein
MTERFNKAMRNPPKGSNAQDPDADRLGAYSDAGELRSPQEATDRDASGPTPPQPAGVDAEVIFTGGPGRSLGGPHATDRPGQVPGSPPGDEAEKGDANEETELDRGHHRPGPFVDRLR